MQSGWLYVIANPDLQNRGLLSLTHGGPGKVTKTFSILMCKGEYEFNLNLISKISLQMKRLLPSFNLQSENSSCVLLSDLKTNDSDSAF